MQTRKVLLAGFICSLLFPSSFAYTQEAPMGVNFHFFNSSLSQVTFANAFLRAGEWRGGLLDNEVDANGYPLRIPSVSGVGDVNATMFRSLNGRYPAGQYTLIFDGTGRVEIDGDGSVVCDNRNEGAPPRLNKRCTFNVTPGVQDFLRLEINSSNIAPYDLSQAEYVRNIRVMLPGHQEEDVLYNGFIRSMHGASAIRFLNFNMVTRYPCDQGDEGTASCVMSWDKRVRPGAVNQTTNKGLAYEHIIDIANHSEADAWINIPLAADDAYIEGLANLFRQRLNPNRKVYVELSNEIWNSRGRGDFLRAKGALELDRYNQARGVDWRQVLADIAAAEEDTEIPSYGIPEVRGLYFVQRSLEVFAIFERAFAGQEHRVVNVLGGWIITSWTNQLLHVLAHPVIRELIPHPARPEAYAVNTYFGGNVAEDIIADSSINENSVALSEILQRAEAAIPDVIASVAEGIETLDAFAAAKRELGAGTLRIDFRGGGYPLELVSYEGGQHILIPHAYRSGREAFEERIHDANRTPWMRRLYTQLYDGWYQASRNGLFMSFTLTSAFKTSGSWGMLEYTDEPSNCSLSDAATAVRQGCKWSAFRDQIDARGGPSDTNPPSPPSSLRLILPALENSPF